ncbi:EamA family transporter [Natronorubrum sp. FCH18a]|uniref:EamA family transporter n=1 Tax=Natronorubrum sp. FCH18a TaxID=3447018 RepID=UPI003F517C48
MLSTLPIGALLAAVGAAGLAVQALCIRYGTVRSQSTQALLVVLAVNLVALTPVAFAFADPFAEFTQRSLLAFVGAGLVGTMAGRAFYYEGIKRIGASRSEPIKASQPLHASLLAVVVLGEVVTGPHFVSMLCIVVGIALITWETAQNGLTSGEANTAALVFPIMGAVLYGIEPVIAMLGFGEGTSALSGLLVKTVSATIGFVAYLSWRRAVPALSAYNLAELRWLVAAGLANTTFLVAYYSALEVSTVAVVVPIVQSSPLLVIVLSALFVRNDLERISLRLGIYTLFVIAGAVGVTVYG